VVAHTINIIGIIVERTIRVMFEVVIIAGLGQLVRGW
jgi:hypothetical protein